MLETFADRRYGTLAKRGLLLEQQGDAQVNWPGRESYASRVAVYVGPDAARYIACAVPPGRIDTNEFRVAGVQVNGMLADGRPIVASGSPTQFDLAMTGAGTTMQIVLRIESPEMTIGRLNVLTQPLRVEWTLLNAIFDGIDWTSREVGNGRRCDSFQFSTKLHRWVLRWRSTYEDTDKHDLKNGVTRILPTAVISTEISDSQELSVAEQEVTAITRLLSLATGASVGAAKRCLSASGVIVEETFIEWPVNGTAENYDSHQLISNGHPSAGALRDFLGQTVDAYRVQENELLLSVVIGYLEQARSNQFIDIRLALTIFALEALTHQLSLKNGSTEEQLANQNIEQKLNRMRKHLQMNFIDKKFVGETRRDIRNPLLHSGQIPNLTMSEKVSWYEELYSLAFKMLLFLLGYKGKWLDLAQGYTMVDAPS